jgi:DNA invertase Pin-like site-specific DNA recombinase
LLSFIYETVFDTLIGMPASAFAAVTQTTVYETLMKLGYARISKADGSQTLNLQMDALVVAGVSADHVYSDEASGKRDDRPGLEACLKALREGDTLYIWKLDRLGRDLKHLVTTVRSLSERGVGLSVLTGQGANIDTTTSSGKLIFGIFAALAEFEGDLIRERTMAGLAAARARGRKGGRQFELTKNQIRLAQSAMANRDTHVADLCAELKVSRATLYRYVGPSGELRDHGRRALAA